MNELLTINNVVLTRRKKRVIDHVSFALQQGQIGCLLGPSGSGKTSLLRCIAGFYRPDEGTISIDSTVVSAPKIHYAPEQRKIGMVFQEYSLFPHLTVTENIAFGISKLPSTVRHKRINEMLQLIGLENCRDRYPHELSGGQQQRVALARSLAPDPMLLLLDEPFSNLDAELRLQLARDVRRLIKKQNTTALLITHNQDEALAVSDMLGVIDSGRLLQWNRAYQIYHEPESLRVATFVGMGSMLKGEITENSYVATALGNFRVSTNSNQHAPGQNVKVLIRPDDIIHNDKSELQAVIIEKQFRGAEFLYRLKLANEELIYCFAPSHHNHKIGEAIGIVVDVEHVIIFPSDQNLPEVFP